MIGSDGYTAKSVPSKPCSRSRKQLADQGSGPQDNLAIRPKRQIVCFRTVRIYITVSAGEGMGVSLCLPRPTTICVVVYVRDGGPTRTRTMIL